MRVLIVTSGNSGQVAPFVQEQIEALAKLNVTFQIYKIVGKGIFGYLYNLPKLRQVVKCFRPDILHAHYGLSGFIGLLARRDFPIITTFHGNDINKIYPLQKFKPNINRYISSLVYNYSDFSIFVSVDLAKQIKADKRKSEVIPCHVNLSTFIPIDKNTARQKLNLDLTKKYALFSSSFKTPIKNYSMAKEACSFFENLELIELSGYSRGEVNLLLNACDIALITSFNEGSNQFLKEAMACNCPVVSTKVGDAEWIIGETVGCYMSEIELDQLKKCIEKALDFSSIQGKTNGRNRIIDLKLDSENISKQVFRVYNEVQSRCVEFVE